MSLEIRRQEQPPSWRRSGRRNEVRAWPGRPQAVSRRRYPTEPFNCAKDSGYAGWSPQDYESLAGLAIAASRR
jgi:hypothetical protein